MWVCWVRVPVVAHVLEVVFVHALQSAVVGVPHVVPSVLAREQEPVSVDVTMEHDEPLQVGVFTSRVLVPVLAQGLSKLHELQFP